jgi:hypothetical protein
MDELIVLQLINGVDDFKIIPANVQYFEIYKQVFGPSSYQKCQNFVDEQLGLKLKVGTYDWRYWPWSSRRYGLSVQEQVDEQPSQNSKLMPADARPWPWLSLRFGISVQKHPVLVKDLIGRFVRVVNYGDPITYELIPGRVTIIKKNGRIHDIQIEPDESEI